MNLVFNTYITDEPLNSIHGNESEWQKIRDADTTFRRRSKLDIFKFTLDSYRYLDFNHTYFWVECEDPSKHSEINEYILNIWPSAFISNKRCLTYKDYRAMLVLVPDDDWIFYSPNNDHVFWAADRLTHLNSLLDELLVFSEQYDSMMGIFYSHLEEFRNLPFKETWFGQRWNNAREPRQLIHHNHNVVIFSSAIGENTSVQILHPKLFKAFFSSWNFGDKEIRRLEDLRPHFQIHNQVSVVPRFDFCTHFDGQPSLNPFILPPLFIPDGYFNKEMDILENNPIYKRGYLNLSMRFKLPPYLDPYCGADFIGSFNDLPLFIKEKYEGNF